MDAGASALDAATALVNVGDGRWQAQASAEFGGPVPGFVFGGYLAALLLRAAGLATDHSLPISFTMHYLRPVAVEAELTVSLVRQAGGRRASSLWPGADVDGERVTDALVWVGTPVQGPDHSFGVAPRVEAAS